MLLPGDKEILQTVVVSAGPSRSKPFWAFLEGWGHAVARIADAAEHPTGTATQSAYDYVGILSGRDYVEEGLANAPQGDLNLRVRQAVEAIDRDFISLTVIDEGDLISKLTGEDYSHEAWWWKRIPAHGPIRDDFHQVLRLPQSGNG